MADKNVTVKVNVKPGNTQSMSSMWKAFAEEGKKSLEKIRADSLFSGWNKPTHSALDQAAKALASQGNRAKPASMGNWSMGPGKLDPFPVKADKKSFKDVFTESLDHMRRQENAHGGGMGAALFGAGSQALAFASSLGFLATVFKLTSFATERATAEFGALRSGLGAAQLTFEHAKSKGGLFPGYSAWVEQHEKREQTAMAYRAALKPGEARRLELANADMQAAMGLLQPGTLNDKTRLSRLTGDVNMTGAGKELSEEQKKQLEALKEKRMSKTGLTKQEDAEFRQQYKQIFGENLKSSVGLAARPASFMGGEQYAKSVYQAAFQSGVDPNTETAQNTGNILSVLEQILGFAQGMQGAGAGNADAVQMGR